MSKKSIVKVISLVLSILILLTVLPVGAFAAETPSVTPETIVEDVTLSEQTENAPIVSQQEMYTLHCAGMAQNFKVEGQVTLTISWSGEQRMGSGATLYIN